MSKSMKIGFKIKLSSETSEKLRHENSELVNIDNAPTQCNEKITESQDATREQDIQPVDEDKDSLSTKINQSQDVDESDSKEEKLVNENKTDISTKVADDEASEPAEKTEKENINEKCMSEDHAQYIHYEGDVAIYTDPSTGVEYEWSAEKNEWVPKINNEDKQSETSSENVTYVDGVATYTDGDGTVFIWDKDKSAWFPKVDDEFLAHYQMSYGFVDNMTESVKEKLEKEEEDVKAEDKSLKRKGQEPPKWFDISDDQNTSVYVSNLPLDISEDEFVELMQKCGIVMRDPTTQKMKVKLYTKPNSKQLKGDALCTYIKIESIELALNILDGYTYKDHRIQVQKASFQMKGEYNPALKPKKKKRKDKDKIKKMQEKLFDWRPEKFRGERSKHKKVVIIKNLFEPKLFDKEVHLILEYQEDLREECAKIGEVRKVCLFDRHPEGVAQIIMKEPEEADNVVKVLNGRWFGQRQLVAEIWDGKTKYKMEETDADLNKRLGGWETFLEDKDKGIPTKAVEESIEFKVPKPPVS